MQETSDPFAIRSGVKQGCVLAPTPLGMFFFLLLSYAFSQSNKWCVPSHQKRWKPYTSDKRDAALTAHSDSSASLHTLVASVVTPSVSRRPTSCWPRSQQHPKHLHRRLHSPGVGGVHLRRLQQPLPRHWTERTNWTSSSSTSTSQKEDLGQHQADHQHQDESVPGLRTQHAAGSLCLSLFFSLLGKSCI